VLAVLAIGFVGTDNGGGVGESGKASELLNERFAPDPAATQPATHTRRERLIFSNPSLDANDPLFMETVASTIQAIR
jgi:hypothetical protein